MTRSQAREQAFALLFEKLFTENAVDEIVEAASEARDVEVDPFALFLAKGAEDKLEALDEKIASFSRKWDKNRISRVALTVMRLAAFEMLFVDEIPVSVAINEAVELAKKYGGDEDSSFVNGILGSISRESV